MDICVNKKCINYVEDETLGNNCLTETDIKICPNHLIAKEDNKSGPFSAGLESIADAVPTNWCDPLLTGKNAAIGNPPYDCQDIERLLRGIKERIQKRMAD